MVGMSVEEFSASRMQKKNHQYNAEASEPKEIMKTRMHSSMMRTVRFNGHLYGACA